MGYNGQADVVFARRPNDDKEQQNHPNGEREVGENLDGAAVKDEGEPHENYPCKGDVEHFLGKPVGEIVLARVMVVVKLINLGFELIDN